MGVGHEESVEEPLDAGRVVMVCVRGAVVVVPAVRVIVGRTHSLARSA